MTDENPPQQAPSAATVRYLSRLTAFLAYALLAVGGATVVCAAYLMKAGYSIVPYWDELDVLSSYVTDSHQSVLSWIWRQHNEHRLLFYKTLLVLDMTFFRGRNCLMYLAIFCSQVALAALLGWLLSKLEDLDRPTWAACFGLMLYCLFCPSQWENFTWAFQLSFVLVNLWAAAAFVSLGIYKQRAIAHERVGNWAMACSVLAAAAATFTNGNGMTVWPALILVAILARLPWRLVSIYAISFACILAVYLVGYHSPSQHAAPLESIHSPRLVMNYVATYLGGAVVPIWRLDWAPAAGLLGLAAAAALVVWLVWRLAKATAMEYVFAGLVFYCVATALLTSLGRLNLGTFQAFSSRYQTFALLFWLALAIWAVVLIARLHILILPATVYLALAVALGYSATRYPVILKHVREATVERELAGLGMITGVHDDRFLQAAILPFPISWPAMEELRAHRMSLFSTSRAEEFGQDFSAIYPDLLPDACQGGVDVVSEVGTDRAGVGLRGWAVERKTGRPVKEVVLVTGGKIAGFGLVGDARPDVAAALHSDNALHSGWVGYAKVAGGERLDLYATLSSSDRNASCSLGAIRIAP